MRRLMHLALAVSDEEASRRFYERHFGFEVVRRAEDGTLMMRNADGFSLALGRWDGDARLPAFLHHGFRAESPDDVHAYAARFRAEGLEIVEESDEPDYVCVKPVTRAGTWSRSRGSRAAGCEPPSFGRSGRVTSLLALTCGDTT